MPSALLQLQATGPHEKRLIERTKMKPKLLNYVQRSYAPYINVATECIEQQFTGTADFDKRVKADLTNAGDLINALILEVTLNSITISGAGQPTFEWAKYIGYQILDEIIINIGGTQIDKHTGHYLQMRQFCTIPKDKRYTFNAMVGQWNLVMNDGGMNPFAAGGNEVTFYYPFAAAQFPNTTKGEILLQVELPFWFNSPGSSLPVISLIYHAIRLEVKFQTATKCYVTHAHGGSATFTANPSIKDATLWCEYIFLQPNFRDYFAKKPHEYLITQMQYEDVVVNATTAKTRVNFNNVLYEMFWVIQEDGAVTTDQNQWSNFEQFAGFTMGVSAPLGTVTQAKLQINGSDRLTYRKGEYFAHVQHFIYRDICPENEGINYLTFSLFPTRFNPSGGLNASRLDSIVLVQDFKAITSTVTGRLYIYVHSLNWFRTSSGVGGIAYV